MALALYVLAVPEFEPVIKTARAAGMWYRRMGDYAELRSEKPSVVLSRDESSTRTAVWYAALTGGLDGHIVSFTADTLHLAEGER